MLVYSDANPIRLNCRHSTDKDPTVLHPMGLLTALDGVSSLLLSWVVHSSRRAQKAVALIPSHIFFFLLCFTQTATKCSTISKCLN